MDGTTSDRPPWVGRQVASGSRWPRPKDPVLLRGEGRYSRCHLPGRPMPWGGGLVRSHNAHGVIRRIDTATASAQCRGVLAIYIRGRIWRPGDRPAPPRKIMKKSRRNAM